MTRKRLNKLLRAFLTEPVGNYSKSFRQSNKRVMRKLANYQIGKDRKHGMTNAELYAYITAPLDLAAN